MVTYIWRRFLAERVARSVQARLSEDVERRAALAREDVVNAVEALRAELREATGARLAEQRAAIAREELVDAVEALRADLRETIRTQSAETSGAAERLVSERLAHLSPTSTFLLPVHGISPVIDGPYMDHSTCSAADMRNRRYVDFCEAAVIPKVFHRKTWEWAFVSHHLQRLGVVGPGRRGLVFGVGTEPLPSYFASLGAQILATDAPPSIGESQGWAKTGQFVESVERLFRPGVIDRETFMSRVSYETCDMTNIAPHLTDFDFCWSSCCFEHLGSLQAGLDFVENAVEKTLRPGGVAIHTTELNLSSNEKTVVDGPTVLYRKRDLEGLIERLRARGHEVDALRIAPDADPLDFYVDMPPYKTEPHLKLSLMGFTSTSVGLVIRRGPIVD